MSQNIKLEQPEWDPFIQNLGFVYYAMAAANGKTSNEDLEHLKKVVQRIWQRYSTIFTGYQGYHSNKIEALFAWLNLNETDWKFCLNEFAYYVHDHYDFLSDGLKQAILDTAKEVSSNLGETENLALKELKELLFKNAEAKVF